MSDNKVFKTSPVHYIAGSDLPSTGWYSDYKDPTTFNTIEDIRALFGEIDLHKNISDIHVKSGSPITVKIKREGLKAITQRCLDHTEALFICQKLTGDPAILSRITTGLPISGLAQVIDRANFNVTSGILDSKNRYRYELVACSSIEEEKGVSMIMRPLPPMPYSYDQVGIPLEFIKKCIIKDGVVIVAGATGEGKSTTIASVIRYIMEHDTMIKGNFISHEDPIEVSFALVKSSHSEVTQSQVGQGDHIINFGEANVSVVRRSPDLVLVGELRDEETVKAAIELSLTGVPVFATTHANNISAILPRLISRFKEEVQSTKCFDLIDTFRFFVAQKLITTTTGERLAVREELYITEALRRVLIKYAQNADVLYRIVNRIMENESFGAVSYLSQAKKLLAEGVIDEANYFYLVGNDSYLTTNEVSLIEEYSNV